MKKRIHHIVATGGPSGGKTQGLKFLKRELEERGVTALVVPEAATICINGGLHPLHEHIGPRIGQHAIMRVGKYLFDAFMEAAQSLSPDSLIVVFTDRYMPDGIPYTPDIDWYHESLHLLGTNHAEVVSKPDLVVFFATPTEEGGYTKETNDARYEDPSAALATDDKTRNAYLGTSRFEVIEPQKDFDTKLRKALNIILRTIGMPVPIEKEKKYLVRVNGAIPVEFQTSTIEQFYCVNQDPEAELRMRKRVFDGHEEYWQTIKSPNPDGEGRREEEIAISRESYLIAQENFRDPKFGIIRKTRTCFLIDKRYYAEMDSFDDVDLNGDPELKMLEIEYTEGAPEFEFPEWLTCVADVTDDPRFKNKSLAKQVLEKSETTASV